MRFVENWLPVVGWEDIYEVSDLGRVRSLDRIVTGRDGVAKHLKGQILRATQPDPGPPIRYARVNLQFQGRKRDARVHVLVLEAFIGPRPKGLVACHGPAGMDKNTPANLRWDTHSSNNYDLVEHGTHWQVRKTHCKNGHEFTPENTIIRAEGGRKCRTCQYAATKQWEQKVRA